MEISKAASAQTCMFALRPHSGLFFSSSEAGDRVEGHWLERITSVIYILLLQNDIKDLCSFKIYILIIHNWSIGTIYQLQDFDCQTFTRALRQGS